MNFIFVSPHFPSSYWIFCARLKVRGCNVLGIGDAPYDSLAPQLKEALTEYYYLPEMENYDQMVRAVGYFTYRYGKIDWIESNNEYWLEQDAKLRTDFHITTGMTTRHSKGIKYKSAMKPYYQKAGVPAARYHMVSTIEKAKTFIKEVGYPVIVKPDNGVGASFTYKLCNASELEEFYRAQPDVPYIMEEFIYGEIVSYDGICDAKGNVIFETSNHFPTSIMDIVNTSGDLYYYTEKVLPEDLKDVGRRTIKAFGVKSRFFHLEFFRLLEDKKGFGKKGDLVALEVNMRPAGGYTPDMINISQNIDVYAVWADMIAYDECRTFTQEPPHYCVYASRRDGKEYAHSHEEIWARYGDKLQMEDRMPDILSGAMGNQMYVVQVDTEEERDEFIQFVHQYN